MPAFLFVLGVITLLLYLAVGIEVTRGGRGLVRLDSVAPIETDAPRITVVVAACNEEKGIENALASVLAQDYPNFDVIAVDDRSTDSTGVILDRMAQQHKHLRVIHLERLPPRWLGKNHALHQAGMQADGELLLFTDADVVMDRSVLRRAAGYIQTRRLDHLAIAPRATVGGFLSNSFLAVFGLLFSLHAKPWKVKDPKNSHHIGIGAFNMVRASAYRSIGGHAPIAMRPDDDMKLGKLIKLRGYRQEFLVGTSLLSVDWYGSFKEMRQGLMKNLFSATEYSVPTIVAASVVQIAFMLWPFVAIVVTSGAVQLVNAAIVALVFVLFALNSELVGLRPWWCLTLPIGVLVGIYLIWRATLMTLLNDGIDWRGTHYSLKDLRANRI